MRRLFSVILGGLAMIFPSRAPGAGDQGPPHFTREGLGPFSGTRARMLAPGMIVELYGERFGPSPWCDARIPQKGPYPTEACGVQVMVGDTAAGLLYVGENQINLRIPDDAPEEGTRPVRVCVHDVCSVPVEVRFSTRKAYLRVQGQAFVHMPLWIEADQPVPYEISYPCLTWPWDFGGYELEVMRDGRLLPQIRPGPAGGGVAGGMTVAPQDSPRSRLPLHLLYRLDQPGAYSVRLTGRRLAPDRRTFEIASQSDWTEIVVAPISEAVRDQWLLAQAVQAQTASPGRLVGDIIPSLLAWPDEKALAVLLRLADHPDNLVRQFVRHSLAAFDADLLRRVIPPGRLSGLRSSGDADFSGLVVRVP